MLTRCLLHCRQHPELLILCLMLVIMAMLVMPLPAMLVDSLIAINLILAVLVFMSAFYIERVLDFSSFPMVLLLSTLFRLALSISTTRLVLTEADAGTIIATFGAFVIGDNLIAGCVIFTIVTLVQFIVITKGAERVAEVAARFSLDAMPGKQMSIDADLKSGLIDGEAAKQRRLVLEQEGQLYGAFDGAMKFIRGDAIAGVVIILVNFIGGLAIGMGQAGMPLAEALATYSMLTIGDGLVAQIPGLLIAIGAGFMVTRINGEGKNAGQSLIRQMFHSPFVLRVAAVMALGMGCLPGFPLLIFVLPGLGLLALSLRVSQQVLAQPSATAVVQPPLRDPLGAMATATVPLVLLLHPANRLALETLDLSNCLRQHFFNQFGIKLPQVQLQFADSMAPAQVMLLLNEIRAGQCSVLFGHARVLAGMAELTALGLPVQRIDAGAGQHQHWLENQHVDAVTAIGIRLRPAPDELCLTLSVLLAQSIGELFGIQETRQLLDQMEPHYPELIKEVYRHASLQRICEILQRLVEERISIRNLKRVLEAIAHWAGREPDVVNLLECIRSSLARHVARQFADNERLRVITLSSQSEALIRQGVRQGAAGAFLQMDPADSQPLLNRLAQVLQQAGLSPLELVLLAPVDVRRFAKRLIQNDFSALEVLSYSEISADIQLDILQTI